MFEEPIYKCISLSFQIVSQTDLFDELKNNLTKITKIIIPIQ